MANRLRAGAGRCSGPVFWVTGGAFVVLAGSATTWAGDWTLSKGVSLSAEYSDNIALSSDTPQSDLVTRLTPNLALDGNGRRLNLSFSYSLSGLAYLENSDANDVRHNLSANAQLEVLEDMLFLNARASASDQVIDASRASGDPLNITGNTTQTWAAALNPYLRVRHGNFASSTLSFNSDFLTFDSGDVGDSNGMGAAYALTSGPEFARLPWSVSMNWQQVSNQDAANDVIQRYAGQVGYVLNRTWTARAQLGWESNDIGSGVGAGEGLAWGTGLTWTPNPRTNGSVTYGQRPFGDTWDTSFSHRSRRSIFGIGYGETLSSSRRNILDSTLATPQEIASQLVPGLPGPTTPGSGALLDQLLPGLPSLPSVPTLPTLPSIPTPGSGEILGQVLPGVPLDSAAVADQILSILIPGLPTQSAQAVEQALQLFGSDSPSLSADVYLQKRLALRYGLSTGRTGIGVSLSHTERISEGSIPTLVGSGDLAPLIGARIGAGGPSQAVRLAALGVLAPRVSARVGGVGTTETTTAAGLSVSRQIGPHVSGQISTSWQQTDNGDSHANRIEVAAGVSRLISEHTSAAIRVGHSVRDAGGSATDDYRENRISLTLSSSW